MQCLSTRSCQAKMNMNDHHFAALSEEIEHIISVDLNSSEDSAGFHNGLGPSFEAPIGRFRLHLAAH